MKTLKLHQIIDRIPIGILVCVIMQELICLFAGRLTNHVSKSEDTHLAVVLILGLLGNLLHYFGAIFWSAHHGECKVGVTRGKLAALR